MDKPLHPVVIDSTPGLLNAGRSNGGAIVSAAAIIQAPPANAAKAMAPAVEARAHSGRCHRRMREPGVGHAPVTPTAHGKAFRTTGDAQPARAVLPLAA